MTLREPALTSSIAPPPAGSRSVNADSEAAAPSPPTASLTSPLDAVTPNDAPCPVSVVGSLAGKPVTASSGALANGEASRPAQQRRVEQPVTRGGRGLLSSADSHRSDPRPAKRIKDPAVFKAFHAIQQECLHCGNSRVNADHLLPRAQGGDDHLSNLIPLCGSGSTGCHGARHGTPYRGDFGRYVTPQAVRESIVRFLRSEAGDDACLYLTSKLGLTESRAWVERAFGEAW